MLKNYVSCYNTHVTCTVQEGQSEEVDAQELTEQCVWILLCSVCPC